MTIVLIRCSACYKRAKHKACSNGAGVMPPVVITACIAVVAIATTVVIATDVRKHARATLRNPDVAASAIEAPTAIQNA